MKIFIGLIPLVIDLKSSRMFQSKYLKNQTEYEKAVSNENAKSLTAMLGDFPYSNVTIESVKGIVL